MRFRSPGEARAAELRSFVATWRPTCSCAPETIELREQDGRLECVRHERPIVRRVVRS